MNHYLQQAKEILSGCLFIPVEKIDDDATIHSVQELDSLTFEMIVMEIEKAIGKEVDPMDLLELTCVKDLARILEQNQ
ncbi:acyl carrier protein [Neisseria sp. Ec49-e6-T10]|uniref:acyl carrier protein n=1 Tax=Neisseria sp. Ec49-e6-T10 TaxID=3140744 RepID=UPI003EBC5DE9